MPGVISRDFLIKRFSDLRQDMQGWMLHQEETQIDWIVELLGRNKLRRKCHGPRSTMNRLWACDRIGEGCQ
jgi:hypothetical protein